MSFLASYTLSKSMDHASGSGGTADSECRRTTATSKPNGVRRCSTCGIVSSSARFTSSDRSGPAFLERNQRRRGTIARGLAGERHSDAAVGATDYPSAGNRQQQYRSTARQAQPDWRPACQRRLCETRTANCWVNPAAFARPDAMTFGNAGRNSLRGPIPERRFFHRQEHGAGAPSASYSSGSSSSTCSTGRTTTTRTARR